MRLPGWWPHLLPLYRIVRFETYISIKEGEDEAPVLGASYYFELTGDMYISIMYISIQEGE